MAGLENILWNVLGTKEQHGAEKYKVSLTTGNAQESVVNGEGKFRR